MEVEYGLRCEQVSTQMSDEQVAQNMASSLPSLTDQEQEALDSLDQSIRIHDHSGEDDVDSCVSENGEITIVPTNFQPFKLAAIPETRESKAELNTENETDTDTPNKKINAGYILFDGSEIKYVNHKTGTLASVSDKTSSIRSRSSTITQNSEVPVNMSMSLDELLGNDYFKSNPRCSITPYRRLPTTAHFSLSEKMYFFFLGLASTITSNALLMSVVYFKPILGVRVLSILGACQYLPTLLAMLLVFCCNRHCFSFFPTVTVSLVMMMGVMAVFPAFAAVHIALPVYAIYGLVCLNGFCTGLAEAVIDKMVILFPGGKSNLLVKWGAGVGCLLPALIEGTLILIKCKEDSEERLVRYNTFCLYIVLSTAGVATILGIISVAKLRRCGIYGLFADIDSAKFSPKFTTISSSPKLCKKRITKIAISAFAVFLVLAVSYYSIALAPYIHLETSETREASKAPFWNVYLVTVFLALYRLGDFTGLLLGVLSRYCCKPLPKLLRTVLYVGFSIIRLGLVALVVLYIWRPFLLYHNLFTMGLYLVLALTNGFLTTGLVMHCQAICGVTRKDLCPIVSQITWLCAQFGCVVGVALSFIPLF